MKHILSLVFIVLAVLSFGQRSHKSHWTVHRSNGTTYEAHRRVSSWHVRASSTKKGVYRPAHTDHGKVFKGRG